MTQSTDVLIIGGGIVGCACAYELAKRGASVTLVEYGKTGMQSTNAAAGMLAPLGESHAPGAMLDAGTRALRAYPSLVDELERACGFEVEFKQDGILRVALDDEGIERMRRSYAWQREMGFDVQWLDGDGCRDIEPRLSEGVQSGLLSPSEATVSNQLIALALERAAIARGADVRQRQPVTRARRSKGRVVSIEAGGETYSAGTIVLAAGARSGQIARKMGIALPVYPMRGQMIALGGMSQPIGRAVWGSRGYLVPRANGLVFAGATVENVGFRRRTTAAGLRALRSMANRLVPQLAAATVHFAWAGLRPATPDGLPFVGPVPGTNVVAATGHFRNGILLGPITGAWVAEGIVANDWSATPPEFRYERLAG
jgi:glycine oxidase